MIERLIGALRAVGTEPDWRDVADVVWLARTAAPMADAPDDGALHAQTIDQAPGSGPASPPTAPVVRNSPAKHQQPQSNATADARDACAPDPVPSVVRAAHAAADLTVAVTTPRHLALSGQHDIARALRPLKQTRRSKVETTLDLERTVDEFCSTRVLVPFEKPALVRWFDEVALVVDDNPTMTVWDDTVDALAVLLARFGAFDRISRWTWGAHGDDAHLTSSGGRRHEAEHLVDYDGRRLTLVITDCVGPLWQGEHGWRAVDLWGRSGPVALVQVLPERLWPATAMGPADVALSSDQRGEANAQLEARLPWWWPGDVVGRTHCAPVVSLDADRLRPWARMLMGGGSQAAGVVIPTVHPSRSATPPAQRTPEEVVATFRATVSTEAATLATLLSAVDVSLPIARILLHTFVPNPQQSHLAELLAGGVLRRSSEQPDSFDFVPGVREQLQVYLTTSMTFEVWRAVTPYLERHWPGAAPFSILFGDGNGDGAGDDLPAMTAVVDSLARRFRIGSFARAGGVEPQVPPRDETGSTAEPAPEEDRSAPLPEPARPVAARAGEAITVSVSSTFSDGVEELRWDYPDGASRRIVQQGRVREVAHLVDEITRTKRAEDTVAAVLAAARQVDRVAPPKLTTMIRSSSAERPTVVVTTNLLGVPWHLLSVAVRRDRRDAYAAILASRTQLSIAPPRWRPVPTPPMDVRRSTILIPARARRPSMGFGEPDSLRTALSSQVYAATRERVIEALTTSDIVHLALMSAKRQRGATTLDLDGGPGLGVDELSQLRLDHAPLVFVNVDRASHLVPALLAAGARAVVAPAWQVDAPTAARVAELFYRELLAGRASADALAEVHTLLGEDHSSPAAAVLAYQHFGDPFLTLAHVDVVALASEYNRIRVEQSAGEYRTEAMEGVVSQLQEALRPLDDFAWEAHLFGTDRGMRLAAYLWLDLHPDADATGRLVHALVDIEDKPFGQVVALRALEQVLVAFDTARSLAPEDRRGLERLASLAGAASDRGRAIARVIVRARSEQGEPGAADDAETDSRIRAARAAADRASGDRHRRPVDASAVIAAHKALAVEYRRASRPADELIASAVARSYRQTLEGSGEPPLPAAQPGDDDGSLEAPSPGPTAGDLTSTRAEVEVLEESIRTLEQGHAPSELVADIEARVAQLRARIAHLEDRPLAQELTSTAWTGSQVATGALSADAAQWGGQRLWHVATGGLARGPSEGGSDPADWQDPAVGYGLLLRDSDDPDLSVAAKAAADDAPDAVRLLLAARPGTAVLRGRPDLGSHHLRRYYDDGSVEDLSTSTARFGVGRGCLPRHIAIIAGPDEIPWRTQYALAGRHSVGRLPLSGQALHHYVEALITDWSGARVDASTSMTWNVSHGGADLASEVTRRLMDPVARALMSDSAFRHVRVLATGAELLLNLAQHRPGLLITSSYGMCGPIGDAARLRATLGLPVDVRNKVVPLKALVEAVPEGAVWFAHAAYSAGSDAEPRYEDLVERGSTLSALLSAVAGLGSTAAPAAVQLLGRERPVRGVFGYVEPSYDRTLRFDERERGESHPLVQGTLQVLAGQPLGLAFSAHHAGVESLYQQWAVNRDRAAAGDATASSDAIELELAALTRKSLVLLGDPTAVLDGAAREAR